MYADFSQVDLKEARKELKELRDGWTQAHEELQSHFQDPSQMQDNDGYAPIMTMFLADKRAKIDKLADLTTLAEREYEEIVLFYGEPNRNIPTEEFFGVFKQFVASYRKSKADNQTLAEAKAAAEKRRIAYEAQAEEKAKHRKATEEGQGTFDSLLEKLRDGSTGTRTRRARRKTEKRDSLYAEAPSPDDSFLLNNIGLDFGAAAELLAQLRNGAENPPDKDGRASPTTQSGGSSTATTTRRSSRRASRMLESLEEKAAPKSVLEHLPTSDDDTFADRTILSNLEPDDEDIPTDAIIFPAFHEDF